MLAHSPPSSQAGKLMSITLLNSINIREEAFTNSKMKLISKAEKSNRGERDT